MKIPCLSGDNPKAGSLFLILLISIIFFLFTTEDSFSQDIECRIKKINEDRYWNFRYINEKKGLTKLQKKAIRRLRVDKSFLNNNTFFNGVWILGDIYECRFLKNYWFGTFTSTISDENPTPIIIHLAINKDTGIAYELINYSVGIPSVFGQFTDGKYEFDSLKYDVSLDSRIENFNKFVKITNKKINSENDALDLAKDFLAINYLLMYKIISHPDDFPSDVDNKLLYYGYGLRNRADLLDILSKNNLHEPSCMKLKETYFVKLYTVGYITYMFSPEISEWEIWVETNGFIMAKRNIILYGNLNVMDMFFY